ncbi:HesB/IscA family protein [Afifella pfennigii]|uniref:HesB/IscA family protein n=1 Tax=Afifella pfennigii TaxID=209897 RepID=UPI000478DE67|nr:iron-sulfur cluster assembly accessory protein [Afifella pfennigii]
MIHLTETAASALRQAIEGAEHPVEGLRLMVEVGGCAGFKYMMGLVASGEPEDAVFESGGIRLFVDEESLPHLAGTTVDFVSSLEGAGFTFDNPQAAWSCACGKSFG